MLKEKRWNWERKSWFFIGGLALGGLALLVWMALGSLDRENPWVTPSEKIAVMLPKSGFTLKAGDRDSGLKEVKVTVTQGGREQVLVDHTFPPGGEKGSTAEVSVAMDPKALGLKEGKATITITARDRSWRNFFQGRTTTLAWDTEVSMVPLRVNFVADNHLIVDGGVALVVYHVNKPPKESGVRVDNHLFRGYPVPKGPAGEYAAFVAIPLNAPSSLPAEIIAREGAGNEVKQNITLRVYPKRWRHDNMNLSEGFLQQITAKFPELNQGDPLKTYLYINRKTRLANHEKIRQVCATTQPEPLWVGAFQRFVGKPMAGFGDQRTYLFQNHPVDEQVHLGVDLASLLNSPVPAANNGVVVHAGPLGIYGNAVIIDHGMGVFTLYGHMSKIDVKDGEKVEKGKQIGVTGTTGLAGGDHLHYSVLVDGYFVNPVEWWDPHWLRDQVDKVWGQPAAAAAAVPETTPAPQSAPAKAHHRKAKKRQH